MATIRAMVTMLSIGEGSSLDCCEKEALQPDRSVIPGRTAEEVTDGSLCRLWWRFVASSGAASSGAAAARCP